MAVISYAILHDLKLSSYHDVDSIGFGEINTGRKVQKPAASLSPTNQQRPQFANR